MGKANDCLQWAVGLALTPMFGEQTAEMEANGETPLEYDEMELRDLLEWRDHVISQARALTGVSPILTEQEYDEYATDSN